MDRRPLALSIALLVAATTVTTAAALPSASADPAPTGTQPGSPVQAAPGEQTSDRGRASRLRVTVRAPRGVAASVTLRRGKKQLVVAKKAGTGKRSLVRRATPGRWRVAAPVLTVGGSTYVARGKLVKLRRGTTRKVVVRYRRVKGVVSRIDPSQLSARAVALRWKKPGRAGAVVVRRTTGGTPAATRRAGTAVRASRTGLIDRSARPGTRYTYSTFMKVRGQWIRTASARVATPSASPTGQSLRYVSAESAVLPTPGQVRWSKNLSGGRLALRLGGDPLRIGQSVMVPRSRAATYGFLGRVVQVGADGTAVLVPTALDQVFDVLQLRGTAGSPRAFDARSAAGEEGPKHRSNFNKSGCKLSTTSADDLVDLDVSSSAVVQPLVIDLKKKKVKFFPDVPYGFDLSGAVDYTLSAEFIAQLQGSVKCAWLTPKLVIPVGGLPVNVILEGRFHLDTTGTVKLRGVGVEATAGATFSATANVATGEFTADGDPVRDINMLAPAASVQAKVSAGLSVDATVGFGYGSAPVGVLAGVRGRIEPITIGASADATAEVPDPGGDPTSACLQATAGGSVNLALIARAWVASKNREKTVDLVTVSWDYLRYFPELRDKLVWCADNPPKISPTRLRPAQADVPYSAKLQVAKGMSGTWAVEEGELPEGLSLVPDPGAAHLAKITGTATAAGTSSFTVRFTDSKGRIADQTYEFTVVEYPGPPVISTTELDQGVVGRTYADQVQVNDRRDGEWTITGGALPAGLTLDPSTGLISGTTTGPEGSSEVTLTFTDGAGNSVEQTYVIDVHPEMRCAEQEQCVTVGGNLATDTGPFAGKRVKLLSPWGDDVVTVRTDQRGDFAFQAMPLESGQTYSITVLDGLPALPDCQRWLPVGWKSTTTADLRSPGSEDLSLGGSWRPVAGTCPPDPDGPGGGGGGSQGDPHLTTVDGVRYDFHAQGEYVAARSTTDDFEVRFRFRRPAGSRVSWNGGAAARVGDSVLVLGDADPHTSAGQLVATLDGVPLTVGTEPELLPGDASVVRRGRAVEVTWADGTLLRLADDGNGNDSTTYTFRPSAARRGQLEGLLGNADGDRTNDLLAADGKPLDTGAPAQLYGDFGDRWLVAREQSWFSTVLPHVNPGETVTLASLEADLVAAATATCEAAGVTVPAALERCILDVAVSGQNSLAAAYAANQDRLVGTVPAALLGGGLDSGVIAVDVERSAPLDVPRTYQVDLRSGDRVQFQARLCPTGSGLQVGLVAPSGHLVAEASGEGCGSFEVPEAPETGRYQIRILQPGGYTGQLAFTLWSVPSHLVAASAPGIPWTSGTESGTAVAAINPKDCATRNQFDQCVGSDAWRSIGGSQWIWAADQPGNLRSAEFTSTVTGLAEESTCTLSYLVDGTPTATFNGTALNVRSGFATVRTVPVTLQPGPNQLVWSVDNGAVPTQSNPVGLTWRIDRCAQQPRITSISELRPGRVQSPPLVVRGTGFGPAPDLPGTTRYFRLQEVSTGNWSACTSGNVVGCSLGWAEDGTAVTLHEFNTSYGGGWSFEDGDVVDVMVRNTWDGGEDTCRIVVGAGATDCTG